MHERFQSTHWSLVRKAADKADGDHESALQQLCENYWFPVYAFVRSETGHAHNAEDLTQAFFAKLLEKEYLSTANPELGRFRTFLLTAVRRFLSNQNDRENAKKRGGGRYILPLDLQTGEERFDRTVPEHEGPEKAFEKAWAHQVLELVLLRLEKMYSEKGKSEHFDLLRDSLVPGNSKYDYVTLSQRLRLSPTAARVAVHRLRRQYRDFLIEEISKTVADPDEVQAEIVSLFEAFRA